MPYRYLEDIAIADVAFEAQGKTLEELFISSADATLNVMMKDLNNLAAKEERTFSSRERSVDMLLYQLLQELIYFKDAQQLLLRVSKIQICRINGDFMFTAEAQGEKIDSKRHQLDVDVKAVTLHRLKAEKTTQGWQATVVLDI